MANTLTLFSSFAAILLASTSIVLSYLVLKEQEETRFTTVILFLGAVSAFLFLGSLFYMMFGFFGRSLFMRLRTRSAVALMFLMSAIGVNGALWQFKAHE
ncbi:MAG: hypothetical protein SVU32_07800 [Candidatus Nanohaloarchaea archaeon]|nr:hypothetical protein [Candidatus Nanohaloarchaea archaeon]